MKKKQLYIKKQDESLIEFSAIREEQHGLRLNATKNSVEEGFDITDHIHGQPREITFIGITSDYNLSLKSSLESVKGLFNEDDDGNKSEDSKSKTLYNEFKALYDSKELVEIITEYETYENMALVSFSTKVNNKTSYSIDINATFQELRIVDDAVAEGENMSGNYSDNADNRAKGKKGKGKKSPVPSTPSEKAADVLDKVESGEMTPTSALMKIIKLFFGWYYVWNTYCTKWK